MFRLRDRFNHEHWPWWLMYLPVFPLYIWQAVRMRRAAFFTNVNPAMDMGGFFGESKSAIYRRLPTNRYPSTLNIPVHAPLEEAVAQVIEAGISFPCIVKPDVGERGQGVRRADTTVQLRAALSDRTGELLVQDLAPGKHEFGLMFARDPGTGRTTLLSITAKRFLTVTGDGQRTVHELLAGTFRGYRQLARLRRSAAELMATVPPKGARVMVEPIGNHCRGTTFIDGEHLRTAELEEAVGRLVSATNGFHYGRFDVRSTSEQALRAGEFTLIELNGVISEPTSIYDPSWSIWRCWTEVVRHMRHLGSISVQLHKQGVEPSTMHAVVVSCEAHFGWRLGGLRRMAALFATEKPIRTPEAVHPQS